MRSDEIKKVACIGAGLIGASWAVNFVMKGYEVNIYDVNAQQLEQAGKAIRRDLDYLVQKNVLSPQQADEAANRARYTANLSEAVKDVQFIQEAVPEKYELKQAILQTVEESAAPETIFASSTSGLLITEIARYAKYPGRCLGAHPYNPPHLIPLVEITQGSQTSPEAVQCAVDFYKAAGKEPVVLQKEALGFIANRLQVALYREAVELVERGVCSIDDVDKAALFGPGLRFGILGPNMIFQLGGGPYGIKGLLHHVGASVELWWADMADWKKWPAGWGETAQAGVNDAMANRREEFGRTTAEIAQFRDNMLIELLKLHGKL